jgi:hypothetical protein
MAGFLEHDNEFPGSIKTGISLTMNRRVPQRREILG